MSANLEAIRGRISVRSYDARPLSHGEESGIRHAIENEGPGPFGGRPRFALVAKAAPVPTAAPATAAPPGAAAPTAGPSGARGERIGTYGFIKGAPAFIVGAIARGPFAMEDFGYCLEGIVLEATRLGLGTCWLGGSLKRGQIADILGPRENELVPAITPVGHPAERPSLIDRVVRRSAHGDDRRPASELFFRAEPNLPLPAAWIEVLEAVRRAPSASNRQPWRILIEGITRPSFHLCLAEDRLYNAALGENRMQNVDMGIAMRHFEVAARELGLPGAWRRLDAGPGPLEPGRVYIASWLV